MNRIPGDLTPPWAGCWGPPRSYLMSEAIYSPAQRNRRTARPTPKTEISTAPRRANPEGERRTLTCSLYKQTAGSPRSSPPGPAFRLQREYLTVVAQGGPLGGSWSGLPWLSYTSRGRKPKIRFLTSSPRRASWCLDQDLRITTALSPPGTLVHREHNTVGVSVS